MSSFPVVEINADVTICRTPLIIMKSPVGVAALDSCGTTYNGGPVLLAPFSTRLCRPIYCRQWSFGCELRNANRQRMSCTNVRTRSRHTGSP